MNKQNLRTQLRKKRCSLDTVTHQRLSTQLADKLIKTPHFQNSQTIACYLARDGEVNTQGIITAIWQQGKECFLPVIDLPSKTLSFALYTKTCSLQTNQYGIPEPRNTKIVPAEALDLIIAPLVGFDNNHHRLGMGGGFYDRTLANCKSKKPIFAGIAFSFQHLETLPHENHDAKLDFVVTD